MCSGVAAFKPTHSTPIQVAGECRPGLKTRVHNTMIDALSAGLAAIDAGVDRLNRAAARTASEGAEGDIAANFVEMSKARQDVRTGVAVARTADEMVGTLLDVLA
jgi:hypothetical protein